MVLMVRMISMRLVGQVLPSVGEVVGGVTPFFSRIMDAWEYASGGSGQCHGGGAQGTPPRDIDGCPEAGDDNCPQMWAFWSLGLMLVAPRLGATGARRALPPKTHADH